MTDHGTERRALALFETMLDIADEERDTWVAAQTEGDPMLAARVAAIRDADRLATLRTGAAVDAVEDEEDAPARIGAYRIVERIGRGGMGSVYRGERMTGDFTHVAAIKLIKPGLLSSALVDRFQRERQTLAALRHPNIAQLHDGGETDSGSPYIVMEYVDGLPLLQWIDANEPDQATRRRLFTDICAAVAFANRNLVVHRDLTPSNVLVTSGGAVKLIDFGIARPVDMGAAEDAGRASLGSLSLTPGFAAPERLTSSLVSTAADVYSLGRLLEKILPPAPGDRELRAIVARATAADPAARYPGADALGADVEAWGKGFPVAAMGRPRFYPTKKFVGRHRLGTAAVAAGLVLLVGALAWALVANTRAQAARAEAEQRFGQTRAIAHAMLFDAYDELVRTPASTRARALLARTGLAYLDALAADADAPVDIQIEAANGYTRLARVTGSGSAGQLGRFADADTLLNKAQAIADRLAATHGDDPAVRLMRAGLLTEQSTVNLYNNNATALARRQAQEAQALMRADAAAGVDQARLFAAAVSSEGDTYLWDERNADARAALQRAEAFIAGLPLAMQRMRPIVMVRSTNLRLLGEAYLAVGQIAAADTVLDRAIALNRALVAQWPDDPALLRKLSTSLRYRATVYRSNGQDAQARAAIEESIAIARAIAARDSNDVGGLQLVALSEEVHAEILTDLRRFPEAYAAMDEVLAAHRRMVALAANASGAIRSMSQALRTAGAVRYNGGDYAGACREWRATVDALTLLDRRGALTPFDRAHAYPEMRDYVRRACTPPRAALGKSI